MNKTDKILTLRERQIFSQERQAMSRKINELGTVCEGHFEESQ